MTSKPPRATLQKLTVRRAACLPGEIGPTGHVKIGSLTLPCALGRTGITRAKREGDKATPAGATRLLYGFYRPDRLSRPFCRIKLRPLSRQLGWCDDPDSPIYNRLGSLPMTASHEDLWRQDGLYDVVFVLDYNIAPRRVGRGSAIFLHCARIDPPSALKPTLGCIALRSADMRRLLPRLATLTTVEVV